MKKSDGKKWAIRLTLVICLATSLLAHAGPDRVGQSHGHFDIYQKNRQEGVANYITEDLLLTSYQLIQANTQAQTEAKIAGPHLSTLLLRLQSALTRAKGPVSEHNRQYLVVLNALLSNPSAQAEPLAKVVQAELDLILAANATVLSPLWQIKIDYSQFKPRGPYTATPALKRYFRTWRYASGVLFAVKASQATAVSEVLANRYIQQAVELTQLIQADVDARLAYEALDQLFLWSVGPSDDLTWQDMISLISDHPSLLDQPKVFRQQVFQYAKTHRRLPRIIGAAVDQTRLANNTTAADVMTGWRLLPSRYTSDSAAFQHLVFDQVGQYQGDCENCALPFTAGNINGKTVKAFPRALEVMAMLGSELAQQTLQRDGDTQYQGYLKARQLASNELGRAQGLAAQQYLLMRQWLTTTDNAAIDEPRRLNSMLSFWTWQRYLGILYAKQSYTLTGKSLSFYPARQPGAWLSPAVELYQALLNLVGLHQRHSPATAWDQFAELLEPLLQLSWKIVQTGQLNAEDEYFLNELDLSLRGITGGVDLPIVVDVHSNAASGEVLQEALGYAKEVWSDRGPQQRARGSLTTHHEFKQPITDRLDNATWRQRLR